MIARGRMVRSGSLADLRAEAGVVTAVRSPEIDRLRPLLEASGNDVRNAAEDELIVDGRPEAVGELAAARQIVLHGLVETGGLEEVFIRLTREDRS
jgi:ABC-2 type transport system ATP-binding protein